MAVTVHDEFDEGPLTFDVDAGRATLSRTVVIDGDQFENLMNEIFGAVFVPGWGFVYAWRLRHPIYTWMFATSAEMDAVVPGDAPRENVARTAQYRTYIKVKVNYEGILLNPNEDPEDPTPPSGTYLTHDREETVEMMTLPGSTFRWETPNAAGEDDVSEDIHAGILIPTTTHRMTWYKVVFPPWTAIRELKGRLNDKKFLGAQPGCLMFTGANHSRTFDLDGTAEFTLSYTFVEHAIPVEETTNGQTSVTYKGWNYFWRRDADTGGVTWQRLVRRSSAPGEDEFAYQDGDFDRLFREDP